MNGTHTEDLNCYQIIHENIVVSQVLITKSFYRSMMFPPAIGILQLDKNILKKPDQKTWSILEL